MVTSTSLTDTHPPQPSPQADPSSGNHQGTPRMLLQGHHGGTDCPLVQTTAEWGLLGHSGRGLWQWEPDKGGAGGAS